IYISYKGQIADANTKAITVVQKAQEVLGFASDEQIRLKYELEFEQKLAQAFYSRGVNSEDQVSARDDFEQAVDHYNTLLDLNVPNKENVMINIGMIYQEMGEHSQAVEQFERILKEFPKSLNAYVRLGNLLLDIEQGKPEDQRNYSRAQEVFVRAGELENAGDNEAYKKLSRRMGNLNIR